MVKMLVIEATRQLNYFVNINGIEHSSPQQLLKESKVDFHKHCQIPIFFLCPSSSWGYYLQLSTAKDSGLHVHETPVYDALCSSALPYTHW